MDLDKTSEQPSALRSAVMVHGPIIRPDNVDFTSSIVKIYGLYIVKTENCLLHLSVLGAPTLFVITLHLTKDRLLPRMSHINYSSNLLQTIRPRVQMEHAFFNLLYDCRMKIILLGIQKQPTYCPYRKSRAGTNCSTR